MNKNIFFWAIICIFTLQAPPQAGFFGYGFQGYKGKGDENIKPVEALENSSQKAVLTQDTLALRSELGKKANPQSSSTSLWDWFNLGWGQKSQDKFSNAETASLTDVGLEGKSESTLTKKSSEISLDMSGMQDAVVVDKPQEITLGDKKYNEMIYGKEAASFVSQGVQNLVINLTHGQIPDAKLMTKTPEKISDPNVKKTSFNGGFDSGNQNGVTVRVDLASTEKVGEKKVVRIQIAQADNSVQVIEIQPDQSYTVKTINKQGFDPNKAEYFNPDGTAQVQDGFGIENIFTEKTAQSNIVQKYRIFDPSLIQRSVQILNTPEGTKEQIEVVLDQNTGVYSQIETPLGQTTPTAETISKKQDFRGVYKNQGTFRLRKSGIGNSLLVEYQDPKNQRFLYSLSAKDYQGVKPEHRDARTLEILKSQAQENNNQFMRYEKSILTEAFLQSRSYQIFKASLV